MQNFFVSKGWIVASKLKVGDKLHTKEGEIQRIKEVSIERLARPVKVYNLEVDEEHTYYVSDSEVLVHNGCDIVEMDPNDINYSQSSINRKFDTPDGKISIDKAVHLGPEQVDEFPPISVLDMKGQYVVRNGNSRLYIAKETKAEKIKVIIIIETSVEAYNDLIRRLRNNGYGNNGSSEPPKH